MFYNKIETTADIVKKKEDKNNNNFNFSYLEISALNNQPFARKALSPFAGKAFMSFCTKDFDLPYSKWRRFSLTQQVDSRLLTGGRKNTPGTNNFNWLSVFVHHDCHIFANFRVGITAASLASGHQRLDNGLRDLSLRGVLFCLSVLRYSFYDDCDATCKISV